MSRRSATDGFSDAIRAEIADFENATRGRIIAAADVVELIKGLSGLLGYTGVHGAVDKVLERGANAIVSKLQDMVKGRVP